MAGLVEALYLDQRHFSVRAVGCLRSADQRCETCRAGRSVFASTDRFRADRAVCVSAARIRRWRGRNSRSKFGFGRVEQPLIVVALDARRRFTRRNRFGCLHNRICSTTRNSSRLWRSPRHGRSSSPRPLPCRRRAHAPRSASRRRVWGSSSEEPAGRGDAAKISSWRYTVAVDQPSSKAIGFDEPVAHHFRPAISPRRACARDRGSARDRAALQLQPQTQRGRLGVEVGFDRRPSCGRSPRQRRADHQVMVGGLHHRRGDEDGVRTTFKDTPRRRRALCRTVHAA